MDRFQQFILYWQVQCTGMYQSAEFLDAVFDPNVQTMIRQGYDETVLKKFRAYFNYRYNGGPKPAWFVLSTEGPN